MIVKLARKVAVSPGFNVPKLEPASALWKVGPVSVGVVVPNIVEKVSPIANWLDPEPPRVTLPVFLTVIV